jgi:hypothetical protein
MTAAADPLPVPLRDAVVPVPDPVALPVPEPTWVPVPVPDPSELPLALPVPLSSPVPSPPPLGEEPLQANMRASALMQDTVTTPKSTLIRFFMEPPIKTMNGEDWRVTTSCQMR